MVKVQDHQGIQDKPEAPEELGGGCLRTWLMKRLMKKNGFKSSPRKFPLNLTWQISLLLQSSVMVLRSSFCFFRGMKSTSAEGAIIIKKLPKRWWEPQTFTWSWLYLVFLWEKKRENRNNDLRLGICPLIATLSPGGAECRKKVLSIENSSWRHVR